MENNSWISNCINSYNNCSYGGYRTYENLIAVIKYIEKDFGKIIKFIKRTADNDIFTGVLTQKCGVFHLVSVGADYVTEYARNNAPVLSKEEQLLKDIFGSAVEVKPHQEYHQHKEMFVKIKNDTDAEIDNIIRFMMAIAIKKIYDKVKVPKDTKALRSLMSAELIINDCFNLHEKLENEENNLHVEFCQIHFDSEGIITLIGSKKHVEDYNDENIDVESILKDINSIL